jgi:hypothetical protein
LQVSSDASTINTFNAGTETATKQEVQSSSTFEPETDPSKLLIETWGFSRANTGYDMAFSGPNVKVELTLFAFTSESTFNIDGGTEITGLVVGANTYMYDLTVGTHDFSYTDSAGDGFD